MVKPLTETEHLQEHFKTSQRKAIVALGDIVRKQALIMGYADTFAILGVLLLLAAGLLLFTRRGQASGTAAH